MRPPEEKSDVAGSEEPRGLAGWLVRLRDRWFGEDEQAPPPRADGWLGRLRDRWFEDDNQDEPEPPQASPPADSWVDRLRDRWFGD